MAVLLNIVLIFAGAITLVKAVEIFIVSTTKIAKKLGVSGYTISFLLVSMATSLPEIVVATTAGINKTTILSLGNALGANIAMMTFVIAIPVLIGAYNGISTRSALHSKDLYYSVIFGLLPIGMLFDGKISRNEGLFLILLYFVYIFVVWEKSHGVEKLAEKYDRVNILKELAIFTTSLALLIAASQVIVTSAISLSAILGLGLAFIGLTITSIGTTLPELAFAISSAKGRHQQEILGNTVGSVVVNSTLVLGIAASLHPITTNGGAVSATAIIYFIAILALFMFFSRSKEKIDKPEAILLLILYCAFLALEYIMQL